MIKTDPLFFSNFGKYDTYKGSTLVLEELDLKELNHLGNMILIKDRHN